MPRAISDELRAREVEEYRHLCARRMELESALKAVTDSDDIRTAHDYRLTLLHYQSAIANYWLHR